MQVAPPVNNYRNSSTDSAEINQFDSTDLEDLYQRLSSPESACSPLGSEYTTATSPASTSTFGPQSPPYPDDDSQQLYDGMYSPMYS